MMVDKIDPNDYVVIADRSQESVQIVSPPTDSKKRWWKQVVNPVFLLNACLGLMASLDQKKCQRAYCCAHRVFIYVLLLFTSAIQNAVCFRRDGFAATLPLSNINETVCDAELHLIVSNIVQEGLVITAYTLLLCYSTIWQPQKKDLIKEIKDVTADNAIIQSRIQRILRCTLRRSVIPLWIVLSFTARLMQAFAFGLFPNGPYNLRIHWGGTILATAAQVTLGSFCLAGFVLFDLVYLAVVVTYVVQCELVRKVVDARSKDILDRRDNRIALTLEEAIHNIGSVRKYILYINGNVSWLVSVVFFNFASSAIIGLWSMDQLVTDNSLYNYNFTVASIARAISTILWLLLLVIPLIQAARLTAACTKLKSSACDLLEERAANWAQADNRGFQLAELYTSYLNTVSSSLKAKIFGIPIHSWAVYSAMVLFAFVLLILTETNTYTFVSPTF